jgi:hypothetical protein
MINFTELKEMIADAQRALNAPDGLTEVQEVSAALFFALGIYIDNINDRLALIESPSNKSLIIGA